MKTILAPGVWDCFHIGHLRHLQAARALGDRLVVSVTPDHYVNKGWGRPVFPTEERADMLRALAIVDYVAVENTPNGTDIIQLFKPDIYVCALQYKARMPKNVTSLTFQLGIEIVFLDTRTEYSTTKIITGELLRERSQNPRQRFQPSRAVCRRNDH